MQDFGFNDSSMSNSPDRLVEEGPMIMEAQDGVADRISQ